ncbi:hypothetical protein Agub_g11862, partial [Astrephomene gubernaculifera]
GGKGAGSNGGRDTGAEEGGAGRSGGRGDIGGSCGRGERSGSEGGNSGAGGGGTQCPEWGLGSALPSSLRSLEADGAFAVPLLLLAAACRDLPSLECLSLSSLPASWTYEEGA